LTIMSSVLIMGFLGSWHCGVMCGPLSCNFRAQKDFFSYHLGRLFSYAVLASLLFFGMQYFVSAQSRVLRFTGTVIFGFIFIYFGLVQLNVLKKNNLLFSGYYKFQFKFLDKNKNLCKKFPLILGLLTGLFPCGWLYSFLLLSSRLESWDQSLLVIFIFWLTALPAFVAFNGFMQNLIKNSQLRYQVLSGAVLIAAGLFSILGHWFDFLGL